MRRIFITPARTARTTRILVAVQPSYEAVMSGAKTNRGEAICSRLLVGLFTIGGAASLLLPNGQVLVAGGINASLGLCGTLASAELYNPSTGTWTATGSMTVGNETNWAVLLQNGEVFVLKPYPIEDTNGFVSLFDPSTLTWASAGSMTYVTTRRNHDRAVRALHAMMAGGDCWRLNP